LRLQRYSKMLPMQLFTGVSVVFLPLKLLFSERQLLNFYLSWEINLNYRLILADWARNSLNYRCLQSGLA